MRLAASRAFCTSGRSRPTRTAMMAITTSSSMSVKPRRIGERLMIRPYKDENELSKSSAGVQQLVRLPLANGVRPAAMPGEKLFHQADGRKAERRARFCHRAGGARECVAL